MKRFILAILLLASAAYAGTITVQGWPVNVPVQIKAGSGVSISGTTISASGGVPAPTFSHISSSAMSAVKNVTGTAPIYSTGGTTPNITLGSVAFKNISSGARGQYLPLSGGTLTGILNMGGYAFQGSTASGGNLALS